MRALRLLDPIAIPTSSSSGALTMNQIAQELDDKLESLDENHVAELARYVRKTIEFYEAKRSESRNRGVANGYPPGYFDEFEGVFADEPFERAPQGELPEPKDW